MTFLISMKNYHRYKEIYNTCRVKMRNRVVVVLLFQFFFLMALFYLAVDVKGKNILDGASQMRTDGNGQLKNYQDMSDNEVFVDDMQDISELEIFEDDKSEFVNLDTENNFNHKNSIFFVEEFFNSKFKHKFLCSIESAAFVHPNVSIDVMVMSPKLYLTRTIKMLLNKHKNIRFMFLNATEFYTDSPLEKWFLSGTWKLTTYPQMNLGDVTRIVLLWKYGGIYLDLDVISMNYLKHEDNFFGIEYPVVNSAIMSFRKHHPFLEECFRAISNINDVHTWGIYGPLLITSVLKERCGMKLPSTTLPKCSDIKLYEEKVFSSIRGRYAVKYIEDNKKFVNKIINDKEILGFHFYNHMSERLGKIPLTKANPIGVIARRFCPLVDRQSNFIFTK